MPTKIYICIETEQEDPTFVDMNAAIVTEILRVHRASFGGTGHIARVMDVVVQNGVEVIEEPPKEEPPKRGSNLFLLPTGGVGASVSAPGTPAYVVTELQKKLREGNLLHVITIAHLQNSQGLGDVLVQYSTMPKELTYFLSGYAHDILKKTHYGV